MKMDFTLLGYEAVTQIHVGEGQSRRAIDLPVARNAFEIPFVPGSAHKGSLRAAVHNRLPEDLEAQVFGPENDPEGAAGAMIFGDLHLLLLPVRSNVRPFFYVTAPVALDQFRKLFRLSGMITHVPDVTVSDEVWTRSKLEDVALEDLSVSATVQKEPVLKVLGELIAPLCSVLPDELENSIALIPNEEFLWLCQNGLPVRAHNRLTEQKTVVNGQLWYEETVPPGTIFVSYWAKRRDLIGKETDPREVLKKAPEIANNAGSFVQLGGNETVGQGWMELRSWEQ